MKQVVAWSAALCICTVTLVLTLVVLLLVRTSPAAVVTARQESPLVGLTDPRGAVVVPGVIWDAVTDVSPYLRLETYIDDVFTRVRVSTTFAGLYVPNRVGQRVRLQLVVSSLSSGCSNRPAQYTGSRADIGPVQIVSYNANDAVLGLAPVRDAETGAFVSPVLHLLQQLRKPVCWSFNVAHKPHTYLSLTVPVAPCFQWCWSALNVSQGLYIVALVPAPDAPWTSAVLDVGTWQSVLPAYMENQSNNAAVIVTTPAGCTFFIRPGTYRVEYTPNARCVLGISAGLSGGALAVDVTNARLGYVPVTSVSVSGFATS
jgi:hypothetical protein